METIMQKNKLKINVLGQEYEIIKEQKLDNPKLTGGGYIEAYSKKIFVRDKFDGDGTVERVDMFQKKVTRHEIIHAFFYEAGHGDYYNDEDLVDCLAILIPKMIQAMQDSDCLDL